MIEPDVRGIEEKIKRLEELKREYNVQQSNNFSSYMSARTDKQLELTINAPQGDYILEAIHAAKQEKIRREIIQIELSELSDEKLLDFLKQKNKNINSIDKDYARNEAEKRNLKTESNKKRKRIIVNMIIVFFTWLIIRFIIGAFIK